MSNYRVVGTFRVATEKEKIASGDKKQFVTTTITRPPVSVVKPIDITSSFVQHQPINIFSSYSENRGLMWGKIAIASGEIWADWEGQRLIIEASARRVIYLKHGGVGHGHVFLQSAPHFITNVTVDTMNRKAAQKMQLTKRFAEWEMHFLTGFIGASHWVGLAAVLSMDVFQQVAVERKRNGAYREAAIDIIVVDRELQTNAPILRAKLLELLIGGVKHDPAGKAKSFVSILPSQMIQDDKTTGRIAGAVAAKFIMNPKNNNLAFYFIFQTIMTQVATKSLPKIPESLGATLRGG